MTLGYEQVAVDLTQTYEFGLLEDFDHLYRYANLYELLEGKQAEQMVQQLTEVMPGRPTMYHHRHPVDNLRKHYEKHTVHPLSRLHALTITAAEQQTMNFYMNMGHRYVEPLARSLYLEIAQVEEEHVTQYESLLDPAESWFEQLVHHEYNECYLYYSFMQQESDAGVQALWELHLNMEIEQLRQACELMKRQTGMEPEQILPAEIPEPIVFQTNKAYVRQVLADQCDLTALGTGYVWDAHERFLANLAAVNGSDGNQAIPSEQVIDEDRAPTRPPPARPSSSPTSEATPTTPGTSPG